MINFILWLLFCTWLICLGWIMRGFADGIKAAKERAQAEAAALGACEHKYEDWSDCPDCGH